MPVRTRRNRRKPAADAAAWETVFSSEFDFFGDLQDAGIDTDAYGRPELEEARAAWKQYGGEFMASFADNHTPWALREFGDPR